MDSKVTLSEMKQAIDKFRDERDWRKFHTPHQIAQAISIEAGELLECFLWKSSKEVSAALKIHCLKERCAMRCQMFWLSQ